MSQSRFASSVEAATNTVVGFGISWAATLVVLPAFGSQVTPSSGFGITCVFAVLSLRARIRPAPGVQSLGVGRGW